MSDETTSFTPEEPELHGHARPIGFGVEGEWELALPKDRNVWQKVANWSHGILTPGNFVTLAGAALSVAGIYEYARGDYAQGAGMLVGGRIFDLADGIVAAKTKTRGEKGALLDAGFDKLLSLGALVTMACVDPVTIGVSVPVLYEQVGIARDNKRIHDAGGEPTPNDDGKYAMFALSGSIFLFMASKAMEQAGHSGFARATKVAGVIAGATAYFLSRRARKHYQADFAALNAA